MPARAHLPPTCNPPSAAGCGATSSIAVMAMPLSPTSDTRPCCSRKLGPEAAEHVLHLPSPRGSQETRFQAVPGPHIWRTTLNTQGPRLRRRAGWAIHEGVLKPCGFAQITMAEHQLKFAQVRVAPLRADERRTNGATMRGNPVLCRLPHSSLKPFPGRSKSTDKRRNRLGPG